MSFKVGDIVRLKSGGPDMAVNIFSQVNGYKCQWFAGKKLEQGFFLLILSSWLKRTVKKCRLFKLLSGCNQNSMKIPAYIKMML
ncbi:hypothetical protein VCHA40P238_40318 [Vibrio chagasii]|nr:hypothetical protein VCHA40P238_40318 [Vibrio chagasii]